MCGHWTNIVGYLKMAYRGRDFKSKPKIVRPWVYYNE